MGRGLILEVLEEYRHRVRIVADTSLDDLRLDAYNNRLAELTPLIAEQSALITEANTEIAAIQADMDTAIGLLMAGDDSQRQVLQGLEREAEPWRVQLSTARAMKALYQSEQDRITRDKARIASWTDRETVAYCADATEVPEGTTVGLIFPPDDPDSTDGPIIRPGHEGGAEYDQARDGVTVPALSQTPAGWYYNMAMLLGTARWRPQYRLATITDIDYSANTVRVLFDDATIQPVDRRFGPRTVNVPPALEGVPVQYMTCHAAAFVEGDRVVVELARDWEPSTAKVIGFESEPRVCHGCAWVDGAGVYFFEVPDTVAESIVDAGGATVTHQVGPLPMGGSAVNIPQRASVTPPGGVTSLRWWREDGGEYAPWVFLGYRKPLDLSAFFPDPRWQWAAPGEGRWLLEVQPYGIAINADWDQANTGTESLKVEWAGGSLTLSLYFWGAGVVYPNYQQTDMRAFPLLGSARQDYWYQYAGGWARPNPL